MTAEPFASAPPPLRPILVAALLVLAGIGIGPGAASLEAQAGVAPREGTVTGPTDRPMVLTAARMLDVRTGEMIENPVLLLGDDRITAVNPSSVPTDAPTLALGDVTLLPGFIDAHTHLPGEISAQSFIAPVTLTEADAAFDAAKHAAITLRAGFTTVRDFGGDVTVALRDAVEAGDVEGPRVVPSRNPLGITGGHCDVTGFNPGILEGGPEEGRADGPWEVVESVRYQIKHGAEVIKTCATAGVLSFEGPVGAQQYTLEELEAMVQEAARHGVKVAAHAHGTEGIEAAVLAGVASIEHGSVLDDDVMALMKERGTWLVPTTCLVDRIPLDVLPPPVRAKAEEVLPVARESLRRAIAAGVPIAFGTDAGVFPHGENACEFSVYVELGMTPLEALRTATLNAAELLGVDDRGALEEGMLADIVAVPGNPLEDVSATERVVFVMQGGRVVVRPGG